MDVFVKQQKSALFMAIRSASVAQITQLLLRRYKTPFPSFKSTGTTKATDEILTQYRLLHINDPTCAKKESRLWKNLRSVIFRMIILLLLLQLCSCSIASSGDVVVFCKYCGENITTFDQVITVRSDEAVGRRNESFPRKVWPHIKNYLLGSKVKLI